MDVQTFRARTLQEALQQVRETMGPDAAIMHTREVQGPRRSLFAKRSVEVDACLDAGHASKAAFPLPEQAHTIENRLQSVTSHSAPASQAAPIVGRPLGAPSNNTIPSEAMRSTLGGMLDAGMPRDTAEDLMARACATLDASHRHQLPLVQAAIGQLLTQDLNISPALELGGDRPQVIALLGPTGAGKTTSLAKLAANYHFQRAAQIGFITLDCFRHGAVDQLLQHAEMLSACLEVVGSPGQIAAALQRLQDCQLIFLDTAGRSPNDAPQLALLGDSLAIAKPDAVHLVVSATSSHSHLQQTLKQFSPLRPTSLLITKLDECASIGQWLPVLRSGQLPISYLASGQQVPHDMAAATPQALARILLGQWQDSPSEPIQSSSVTARLPL